jgi:hypothetical protein
MQLTTLIAGQTLQLLATYAAYPASEGWAVSLALAPRAGGAVITVNSTASGDSHQLTASYTVTAAWAPGAYGWEAWAVRGGDRFRVDAGQLTITAGLFGASTGGDTRSAAQQAYDAVTLLLQGKGGSGVETYQINGRMLRSYPLSDLIKLQQKLRADVNLERVAAGLPPIPGGGVQRILLRTP